jgi:tellurite methyltransferase
MSDWTTYFKKHALRKPREQLVQALAFCKTKERALDLGAGTLIESKHLLDAGFNSVTAIDSSALCKEFAEMLPKENFELIISSFQDFTFMPQTYDLINAQYALPFHGKKDFDSFIEKIIASLKPGGILVGQFFGIRDGWNTDDSVLAFQTKEEVLELLKNLEMVECIEEEKEGKTASGNEKYWHVFHVIARKVRGRV